MELPRLVAGRSLCLSRQRSPRPLMATADRGPRWVYGIGSPSAWGAFCIVQRLRGLKVACPRCGKQTLKVSREPHLIFRNWDVNYRLFADESVVGAGLSIRV